MTAWLWMAVALAGEPAIPATDPIPGLVWRADDPATFHVVGRHIVSVDRGTFLVYDLEGRLTAQGFIDHDPLKVQEGVVGEQYVWIVRQEDASLALAGIDGWSGKLWKETFSREELWPGADPGADWRVTRVAAFGGEIDLLLEGQVGLRGQLRVVRVADGRVLAARNLAHVPHTATARDGILGIGYRLDKRRYRLETVDGVLGTFEVDEDFDHMDGPYWFPGKEPGTAHVLMVLTATRKRQLILHRHTIRAGGVIESRSLRAPDVPIPSPYFYHWVRWQLVDHDQRDGRMALSFAFGAPVRKPSTAGTARATDPSSLQAPVVETAKGQSAEGKAQTLSQATWWQMHDEVQVQFLHNRALLLDEAFSLLVAVRHEDAILMSATQARRDTRDLEGRGVVYGPGPGFRLFQDVRVTPDGMHWWVRTGDVQLTSWQCRGDEVIVDVLTPREPGVRAALRAWPGIFYDVPDGRLVTMWPNRGLVPASETLQLGHLGRPEDLFVGVGAVPFLSADRQVATEPEEHEGR